MDDTTTMENMHLAYKRVEDGIKDLDNKSFHMISIIGIMMTLQLTLIPHTTTISNIFLILSLILYFISILLFIMIYPTNESVCYHYEYDVSHDYYISEAVGDYDSAIEYNRNIIQEKGMTSKYAFYFFIAGLFSTLLTVGFMLL